MITEDIPEIPQSIVSGLNRYQNVRLTGFLDWSLDGEGVYESTRFGDVNQVQYANHPGGARQHAIILFLQKYLVGDGR